MSKTILFFGNERLATGATTATPILKALVLNGYNVAAIIVASPKAPQTRKPKPLEVEEFADKHNIPLLKLSTLKTNIDLLKSYPAEIAVLAAFGKMVPNEIIDIFPYGIINIHPSLLPKHRGSTPIESPILLGEKITGVSLMQLVAKMDAGPIYDQQTVKLTTSANKQSLADKLGELGATRLIELLPAILSGKLKPMDQKEDQASYDQKISTEQAVLDFTKPAKLLEREVRAFYGWPKSKTTINNTLVIITQTHILDIPTNQPGKLFIQANKLGFETPKGVLMIDRLIPAGSKEMSIADYLRGYKL
jgi:methionyl-tRNA formyltransferase